MPGLFQQPESFCNKELRQVLLGLEAVKQSGQPPVEGKKKVSLCTIL